MTIITKKELIKTMVEELKEAGIKVTQKDLCTVIDTMTDTIADNLSKGNTVKLPGFVTFEAQEVAAREARNPRTGESVSVPEHKRVRVKISKPLKELVH